LRGADLFDARLTASDLSTADLSYADLTMADLSTADLRQADLRHHFGGYAKKTYKQNNFVIAQTVVCAMKLIE
jgi:uncharacterized protein YjbI with pentapeptide repeats